MPQMKPMNWMFLYLSFYFLLKMMNLLNFFMTNMKPTSKFKKKMMNENQPWKW